MFFFFFFFYLFLNLLHYCVTMAMFRQDEVFVFFPPSQNLIGCLYFERIVIWEWRVSALHLYRCEGENQHSNSSTCLNIASDGGCCWWWFFCFGREEKLGQDGRRQCWISSAFYREQHCGAFREWPVTYRSKKGQKRKDWTDLLDLRTLYIKWRVSTNWLFSWRWLRAVPLALNQ